jgi:hypothetical protein
MYGSLIQNVWDNQRLTFVSHLQTRSPRELIVRAVDVTELHAIPVKIRTVHVRRIYPRGSAVWI